MQGIEELTSGMTQLGIYLSPGRRSLEAPYGATLAASLCPSDPGFFSPAPPTSGDGFLPRGHSVVPAAAPALHARPQTQRETNTSLLSEGGFSSHDHLLGQPRDQAALPERLGTVVC